MPCQRCSRPFSRVGMHRMPITEAHGIMENARENAKVLIRGFLAGCYDLALYSVEFEQAEGDRK